MNQMTFGNVKKLREEMQATFDDHHGALAAAGGQDHPLADGAYKRRFTLTYARLAVLRTMEAHPDQALCREDIFRLMKSKGLNVSISTVYRIINELTAAGILLQEWSEARKALYRIKPRNFGRQGLWLKAKAGARGSEVAVNDAALLARILSVAREHGLNADDGKITIVLG